eukprot:3923529-Rhodomonas_salina.1
MTQKLSSRVPSTSTGILGHTKSAQESMPENLRGESIPQLVPGTYPVPGGTRVHHVHMYRAPAPDSECCANSTIGTRVRV